MSFAIDQFVSSGGDEMMMMMMRRRRRRGKDLFLEAVMMTDGMKDGSRRDDGRFHQSAQFPSVASEHHHL